MEARPSRRGNRERWEALAAAHPEPEDLVLALIPKALRETVQELRAVVKDAVPGVKERARPEWKSFNYDHNGALLAISAYQNWASMGFVRGDQLDDPDGLLEGSGKGMRHVRIARGATVPRGPLAALVRRAVALNDALGPPKGIGRSWGGGA